MKHSGSLKIQYTSKRNVRAAYMQTKVKDVARGGVNNLCLSRT